MDFRLPQPLKYSLKKKKARRKMLRKETGKLSLKNHNKNASCQTDSSESSELSGASSSKRNTRHSKARKSSEKTAVSNNDYLSRPEEPDQKLDIDHSSIYHYCTPGRRKNDIYNYLHGPAANITKSNRDLPSASEDLCCRDVNAVEIIEGGRKSLRRSAVSEGRSNSILIPDSDSDSSSASVNDDCIDERVSESLSNLSDASKVLLESSLLNSEGTCSSVDRKDSAKSKITNLLCFDENSVKKIVPLVRSSVLHKKFNRVVENDLAIACSSSDFYMRVKNRVLGLRQSNNVVLVQGKILDSPEAYKGGENVCRKNDGFPDDDKENVDENEIKNEKPSSQYETVKRRTMIVPDSEDGSTNISSPNQVNNSNKLNYSRVSEIVIHNNKSKSIVVLESSISTLQDADSQSSDDVGYLVESTSVGSDVVRWPKIKKKCVIPDSEESSECDYPKRTEVCVIDSSASGSSVIELHSESCDVEVKNEAEDSEKKKHSEERSHSRKALWSSENGDHKSDASEKFQQVTIRASSLESSGSFDKTEKACDTQKKIEINMQFKPGFSTLSQSKHEDIKKWLNAIPCHTETDVFKSCAVEVKTNSGVNSKGQEDDNVSLTAMEKVLDELYGKDWGGTKKPIAIKAPKKLESQIICQRLTDSDDSSTPPLPASTPKKKLYNHIKNVAMPKGNNHEIPNQGKNIFTPLSTVGTKGRNNILNTPRTAGPKCRRAQECLNSGSISSPILTFLSSLSVDHQSARCHPEAKYYVKNFKSKKNELSQKLFEMFNKNIFDSKLPHDMPIIWNNRLRKTAGYCYNRRVKNSQGGFTRASRIELSSKILDNPARLRDTLIHELCHAATWIISEVTGGHGPSWKKWTNKAMLVFPEIPSISRCHNYDIVTKYRYQCTVCKYSIGRHSKSLDIQRKCCGVCGGTFELFLNAKDEAGKSVPRTPRTPNAFALFVKENYKVIKSAEDKLQHKDVMKLLSEQFAKTKISTAQLEK